MFFNFSYLFKGAKNEWNQKQRAQGIPSKSSRCWRSNRCWYKYFGAVNKPNIACKGWAAFDESGELKPWKFERRAVGDDDILIEVMAASICHSDIHTELGNWGKQIYPQVPGHEIVGIVREVGKNVKNFKIGDRAGVGCMVDNTDIKSAGLEEQYSKNTIFTYGYPYPKWA